MLIETSQQLDVDDRVQMQIALPPNTALPFLGRIVSCNRIDDSQERFDIGIEFIEMSEGHRERLTGFFQGIEVFQGIGIPPEKNDVLNQVMSDEAQTNVSSLDVHYEREEFDRDGDEYRESPSREAIDLQLINLMREIKLLLGQLRTELPAAVAHNILNVTKLAVSKEMQEPPVTANDRTAQVKDDVHEYDFDVSDEEYGTPPAEGKGYIEETGPEMVQIENKTKPHKVQANKKSLKLWHIVIPILFLLAATASFMLIYTPEKQQAISQPGEAKKEMLPLPPPLNKEVKLPAAAKTPKTLPASVPEGRKDSAVAASQAGKHNIELIASESTWLSATIDEKASKEMILKAGDKVKWTAKNSISLVIGNAAGLKIIFDGKEISPLGGKGKVVKLKLPASRNS
jgi:hypothetical protein